MKVLYFYLCMQIHFTVPIKNHRISFKVVLFKGDVFVSSTMMKFL